MRRVRLTIRGMVQGVSYRATTAAQARGLGVSGWVRNLPDGGVLAEAQGPRDQIDALIAWCHHGPRLAQVEAVQVVELDPIEDDDDFEIRA